MSQFFKKTESECVKENIKTVKTEKPLQVVTKNINSEERHEEKLKVLLSIIEKDSS